MNGNKKEWGVKVVLSSKSRSTLLAQHVFSRISQKPCLHFVLLWLKLTFVKPCCTHVNLHSDFAWPLLMDALKAELNSVSSTE